MEKIIKHYQEIAKYWENMAAYQKERAEKAEKNAEELHMLLGTVLANGTDEFDICIMIEE